MTLAIGVAVGSVAAGALLAFAGTRAHGWLGVVRTFALVASVVVVLAHLLPDALAEVGMPALGVFAVALFFPAIFERIAHEAYQDRDASWIAVEIGYAGLLVHTLGDGVALGLYGGAAGSTVVEGPDVLLAIGAHTIPVTAVMTLAFAERYGLRQAAIRAAGIAAMTIVGIALVGAMPHRSFEAWETLGPISWPPSSSAGESSTAARSSAPSQG